MKDKKAKIDTALIDSRKSVNHTRIWFPYDWTKADDDTQWEISQAAWGSGADDPLDIKDIPKDIPVFVSISPCKLKAFFLGGFRINSITFDGMVYSASIPAKMNHDEVCKILKDFFAAGAPGLDREYSKWFERYFNDFLEEEAREANIAP